MPGRNFTDEQEAEIARRYLAGESCKAIGRSLGKRHHISIVDALRRQGVEQRPAPERNRLYKLNAHALDIIDERAAYWWGFLYADGCVSRRTLIVTLKASDAEHLEKFKKFMGSEAPVKLCRTMAVGKWYERATISMTDRDLVARLKLLGIEKDRLHPNKIRRELPPEMFRHWFRGFIDGDGGVKSTPCITLCGSETFLWWIRQQVHVQIGLHSDRTIHKHKTANIFYLNYDGRNNATAIHDFIYQDASVWLARKRDRMEAWPPPTPRDVVCKMGGQAAKERWRRIKEGRR